MYDASCRREDLVGAFQDLVTRLDERRAQLWKAYREATGTMTRRQYEACEEECWSVLRAALSGIDAEHRLLQRDFEGRMAALDRAGVAV